MPRWSRCRDRSRARRSRRREPRSSHYERGEKLFALGKFDEALDEYQKAFDAKPLPGFLFNIGQCYRNLGDYDSAIFSYKKFLKLEPDAPNRDEGREADRRARGRRRRAASRRRLRVVDKPTADRRRRRTVGATPIYKQWWFWTGVAVVAVAGGGFGIYEVTKSSGPPSTPLGNIVFGQ